LHQLANHPVLSFFNNEDLKMKNLLFMLMLVFSYHLVFSNPIEIADALENGQLEKVKDYFKSSPKALKNVYKPELGVVMGAILFEAPDDVIGFLIESYPEELEFETRKGLNTLYAAVKKNRFNIVKQIAQKKPDLIHKYRGDNYSAMELSASSDSKRQIFTYLAKASYLYNDRTLTSNTFYVAVISGSVNIMNEIASSPNRNYLEKSRIFHDGNTFMHIAVQEKQLKSVKYLFSRFPNMISSKNRDNQIPLHLAAQSNSLAVVKYLVKKSSQSYIAKDNKSKKPIDYAGNHSAVYNYLQTLEK
jgi:ankyrin repeat protein